MKRGIALIEFAGSLILLATLFAGIFQLGYAFYVYGTLVDAVRAGARYASLRGVPANAVAGQLDNAVRNIVVYGDASPSQRANTRIPGITAANVEVDLQPAAATVRIRGYKLDSLFSRWSLDGRPSATFPVIVGPPK